MPSHYNTGEDYLDHEKKKKKKRKKESLIERLKRQTNEKNKLIESL